MFDVYVRISKEGGRTEEEVGAQLDEYEDACRRWAGANGVGIGLIVRETGVSGSVKVNDRGLGRLIQRVEAHESAGVLTTHLDRFGRDLIEGCLAVKRIVEAEGRLVCCSDGIDTAQPGSKTFINLRLAIAEDYLDRIKSNLITRQDRAAREGIYLSARVPRGYTKAGKGQRLEVDEALRPMIVDLFEMRARKEGFPALIAHASAKYGTGLSKSGVRWLIRNRAYLGEMKVQTGRKGETRVEKGSFPAIVTEAQYQAAQIGPGTFFPRNGKSLEGAVLRGLVYCSGCGKRCKIQLSGKPEKRVPSYACTTKDCSARASLRASRLDPYVEKILRRALISRAPHVAAIIEGDAAYQAALADVTAAQRVLEDYRDDVEVQEALGMDSWKKGLEVRSNRVTVARVAMNKLVPTASAVSVKKNQTMTFDEFMEAEEGERFARFIDRILLKPSSKRGATDAVEERAEVWFIGADSPAGPVSQQQLVEWHEQYNAAVVASLAATDDIGAAAALVEARRSMVLGVV